MTPRSGRAALSRGHSADRLGGPENTAPGAVSASTAGSAGRSVEAGGEAGA